MIEKIPFGRTGHLSTRVIFGAAALSQVSQRDADATLDVLLQYGINHIDTAASYGESELRIGPWMEKHRDRFFLATKTGERPYAAALAQIQQSLKRLRVDQIDLIQLHYLVDAQEWEIAMNPGGALDAAVEARERGWVRFIGVTGHDLAVTTQHHRALQRFDFDSVLLPYNYTMMQNPDYSSGFETLVAECQRRRIAVQTIKSISRGRWQNDGAKTHATWYEPMTDQDAIDKAVHWVLGREGIFLNTVGDITLLPKVLDAANRFTARPTDDDMQALTEQQGVTALFTA